MKAYMIHNLVTGENRDVRPIVYEDAMNPGHIRTMPVQKTEEDGAILLAVGFDRYAVSKADVRDGKMAVEEYEFIPTLPKRNTNPCNPCRNCGACG